MKTSPQVLVQELTFKMTSNATNSKDRIAEMISASEVAEFKSANESSVVPTVLVDLSPLNPINTPLYAVAEAAEEVSKRKRRRILPGSDEYAEHLLESVRGKLGQDTETFVNAFQVAQKSKSKEAAMQGDKLIEELINRGCSARELKYVFKIGHNRFNRIKLKEPKKPPGGVNGHEVKQSEVSYAHKYCNKLAYDDEKDKGEL